MAQEPSDLEDVLGELERTVDGNGSKVAVGEIVEAFGPRSFGPLLLLGGLLGMTPVAAIPTAPTTLAVLTILVSGQLLLGRRSIWIPRVLARLRVKSAAMRQAVRVSQKPASVVDGMVRPRLSALTTPLADRLVALACILVAVIVPPLELLPLAAFIPSLAIFLFGLGLVVRDGVVVVIAFLFSAGAYGFAAWRLLF